MILGTLQVELHFPEPQSLKEKRSILKSLVARLRKNFNVATAELDGMDLWQRSVIAISTVGRETKSVNQTLSYVANFLNSEQNFQVIKEELEIL